MLAEQSSPVAAVDVARSFKRAQAKKVAELLVTLESLGQAREDDGRFSAQLGRGRTLKRAGGGAGRVCFWGPGLVPWAREMSPLRAWTPG